MFLNLKLNRTQMRNESFFIKLSWPFLVASLYIFIFALKLDFVGISFLLLTLQSAAVLGVASTRPASLILVYGIFSLIFISLVPWLHYSENISLWRSAPLTNITYLETNVAIFIANFFFLCAYALTKGKHYSDRQIPTHPRRRNLTVVVLVLVSSVSFLGVLRANNLNFQFLLFRGLLDQNRDFLFASSSFGLIFSMVTRLAPAFSFYYAVTELRKASLLKAVLFSLLVLAVFPTGVARYMVAYVYIPVLMIIFPLARNGTTFSATLILAIFFVFPFLDQFRYFAKIDDLRILPTAEFFFSAHFDAYENFASAVEARFVTSGYQLLGALLFFVPRTMWASKPVGSGYEMANNLGYSFNNISMPFLGEGYVNFGFPGIFLFAVILGCIMARIDKTMLNQNHLTKRLNFRMAKYYFMFGAIFFVLRGDLLSSFAYMSAGLAVAFFIGTAMRFLNARYRI